VNTTRQREDWPAIVADLAVVVAFAAIGRASHGESLGVGDVLHTALPFAAAALITHLIYHLRRVSTRGIAHGSVVWLATWLAGMGLRLATGASVAWAFLAVAGAFLALGLLGWRLVYRLVTRGRAPRQAPPSAR